MTNSVRPSSEAMRTGTVAFTLASERGGSPAILRSTGTIVSWKVNIADVGKPGRITTGFEEQTPTDRGLAGVIAVAHRKAQRLAGFKCDAMREDAGLAEPADDAMGHVTRALRGAAREHQHV